MPYPAIWTKSQRGQLSADYESVAFPGNTFIFLQKRKTQECSYFRCAHCSKAMKLRSRRNETRLTVPIVRATLEEGFWDDPDNPPHPHFCIYEEGVDTSHYAARARFIYNKVKLELLNMPMTPRQAWIKMESEVIANFPDPETQREIIRRLPNDKSAKRSFARRSSVGKRNLMGSFHLNNVWLEENMYMLENEEWDEQMLVGDGQMSSDSTLNDPRNIPTELLRPCGKRPHWVCAPGREQLANFFLIYRDNRPDSPPFMVFSDMMGINLLHKCNDIVCEGNSNFYPCGFAQLYTFHAVHDSIPEEAHLCAFALLPNTESSSYLKLFDIISERIVTEFGDQGTTRNWHFDNQVGCELFVLTLFYIQSAALDGCHAIFQNDIVEGNNQRTAEFVQLWHEHLHSLFGGPHPNLIRFIRVMRQELARASAQAERIFVPPQTITAINLDNIEVINKLSGVKEEEPVLFDYHTCESPMTRIVNDNHEIALVDQRNGVVPLPLPSTETNDFQEHQHPVTYPFPIYQGKQSGQKQTRMLKRPRKQILPINEAADSEEQMDIDVVNLQTGNEHEQQRSNNHGPFRLNLDA